MLYMGHAWLLQKEYELAQSAYQKSVEIRNALDQASLSMEPIAGLVDVSVAINDLEVAALYAEKIIRYIQTGSTLEGTDEPLRVYQTCYRFLEKIKDPRSRQVLQQAKQLLEAQVSKFKSETERKRYIENIPWRQEIWNTK